MQYLLGKILKWRRKKATTKRARIDEHTAKFFDAVYENNFKLAKILIDSGKVEVNIKVYYDDTPLIVVCQWTTLQNEDEAVKFITYLWQSGFNFHTSNDLRKTAMHYAMRNDLMKIMHTLLYIQWKILYYDLHNVDLI
jgi:ankyrin repeat protein